jgi:hypothetical protein
MAAPEPDTQEPKMTDEQLKTLKRQVSGIPQHLHTAAPVVPPADVEQQKSEPPKAAEQPKP